MEELQHSQSRVDALLQVPHSQPPAHTVQATAENVVAAPRASFSPFDPVQAQQANLLAHRAILRLALPSAGKGH